LAHFAAQSVSVLEVPTFGSDSVLTPERGVTVVLTDGSEFRLTIVKCGT
jgi:hypothetical protein